MSVIEKSWRSSFFGNKILFAKLLTHTLSKQLDREKFEVIINGRMDFKDISSEQPDIVIYNKKNNFEALVSIEICNHQQSRLTLDSMWILSRLYKVKESFVFDYDYNNWFRIAEDRIELISISNILNQDLDKIFNESISQYHKAS